MSEIKPGFVEKFLEKSGLKQVPKYENYRGIIWFCIGYTTAIIMSFMNVWWTW